MPMIGLQLITSASPKSLIATFARENVPVPLTVV
jgi:hypothetical protein